MSFIVLRNQEGNLRYVNEGEPYRREVGEVEVGSSDSLVDEATNKVLEEAASRQGIGVGDLIAQLAQKLGIPHCSKCEQRRQVLNRLRIGRGRK